MKALPLAVAVFAALLAGCVQGPGGEDPRTGDAAAPEPLPVPAIEWASLDAATIRPGVQMVSGTSQCTSNFVFTSPDNASVYLGFAAHCVDNGSVADQDGCDAAAHPPLPLGSKVEVQGASKPAYLAYTSWRAMQDAGETDFDACQFNDFAVVRLDPADHAAVNPAMLRFGGPTGVADIAQVLPGDKVLSYGNSPLRLGVQPLLPHEGYVVSTEPSGWSTAVYMATPGIPGDSGSGVLLGSGLALGDRVTLEGFPPGANRVSTLALQLDYAREKAGLDLRLATWDLLDPGVLPP